MKNLTHTMGPWKISKHGIHRMDTDPDKDDEEYGIHIVAKDSYLPAQAYGTDKDEVVANAALIAAAPDLLEACKESLGLAIAWAGYHQSLNNSPEIHPVHAEIISKIQAAIRKAEGHDL